MSIRVSYTQQATKTGPLFQALKPEQPKRLIFSFFDLMDLHLSDWIPVTTCLDPRFNSLVDWLVCSLEIFPGWNAWTHGTVDGRNPAPVGRYFIPLFSGFHTSQVVQDFFYQQYDMYDWLYLPRHIVWGHLLRFAIQRPPYRPKHGSPQEGMTGCLGFSCISLTFMVNY